MTTKIITPAEVTIEMLVAGVESNETESECPARFQLVGDKVLYSVKWNGEWELVDTITFEQAMVVFENETYDDTIWTTPIQETAQ